MMVFVLMHKDCPLQVYGKEESAYLDCKRMGNLGLKDMRVVEVGYSAKNPIVDVDTAGRICKILESAEEEER